MKKYMIDYRKKNNDKLRKYRKKYLLKNRAIILKKRALYRIKNKKILRKKWLLYYRNNRDKAKSNKRKCCYGITTIEFKKILKDQHDLCAICKKKMRHDFNRVIDHNHKNGFTRGILCRQCNCGVGFLGDRSVLIKNAFKYIKKWDSTHAIR